MTRLVGTMIPVPSNTPLFDGFWMPGEFERHAGCWMLWPQRTDVWRLGAKPAQSTFAEVANAISASGETVTIGVLSEELARARAILRSEIRVLPMDYDDAWARDCGPTFVVNAQGELRGVDWTFNAWGGVEHGAYHPWQKDDAVAQAISAVEGCDFCYRSPLVTEGGAILADGQGTVIVTEPSLIGSGRNQGLGKTEIESLLLTYLGAKKVLWLPFGADGDETGGHIDVICAFSSPGTVLLSWPVEADSERCQRAQENLKVLQSEPDAIGRALQIIKIPEPPPHIVTQDEVSSLTFNSDCRMRVSGEALSRTHLNFYIANSAVVVPVYGCLTDVAAVKLIERAFPNRAVIPVYSHEIVLGGGSIHCITQQVPAAMPRE